MSFPDRVGCSLSIPHRSSDIPYNWTAAWRGKSEESVSRTVPTPTRLRTSPSRMVLLRRHRGHGVCHCRREQPGDWSPRRQAEDKQPTLGHRQLRIYLNWSLGFWRLDKRARSGRGSYSVGDRHSADCRATYALGPRTQNRPAIYQPRCGGSSAGLDRGYSEEELPSERTMRENSEGQAAEEGRTHRRDLR